MAGSNWNSYLDRLLATPDLTVGECRLALALMRLMFGWNKTEHHIGQRLLMETAQITDRRTLTRDREGLVAKGLIRYEPGKRGRGNRSRYALLLEAEEKSAPQRPFPDDVKGRTERTKKGAPQRPRRGRGRGKNSATPVANPNDLHRRAFDAYLGAGGPLLLDRERGALASGVKSAVKEGVSEADILAACRDLGRNREFPGLLKQRVTEILERGGLCDWEGFGRARLTPSQLSRCKCARCAEWLAAISTPVSHEGSP